MKKGYFAIGIYETKEKENVGTLWRSAINFGADFIFTIGARYSAQRTDTMKSWRNIPLFAYKDFKDFLDHVPQDAELVFIERARTASELSDFKHPKRALYILGSEDDGVPTKLMRNHKIVSINTESPLNVAVAGSIVMYDRSVKK